MEKLILISLIIFSWNSFSQGTGSGGNNGGPGIILRLLDKDILIGPGGTITNPDRIRDDIFNPNIKRDEVLLRGGLKDERVLNRPLDIFLKGVGAMDLETFKEETPKSLWREEEDKIIIDSSVPVVNWQDEDGEIHEASEPVLDLGPIE